MHSSSSYQQNAGVAVIVNSAVQYGSWSYGSGSYYYSCSTTSSSLTSCGLSYTHSLYSCDSNDYAGVWCMTVPPKGQLTDDYFLY